MATTEPTASTGDASTSLEDNPWVQWLTVLATVAGLIVSYYAIKEARKGRG